MQALQEIVALIFGLVLIAGGIVFILSMLKKSKLEGNVQVAAHTGDAETLTFNLNLPSDLSYDEKEAKVFEAFAIVAARRKHTHEQMEDIRQKAREEAEARAAEAAQAQGSPLQAVPHPEGQA